MTKNDINYIFGISRPTIDKHLKDNKKRKLIFFLMSFSKFEVIKRIKDYQEYLHQNDIGNNNGFK